MQGHSSRKAACALIAMSSCKLSGCLSTQLTNTRGLQRLIGLKYERDPKRGTRGKPGGFLLIWPAMGLDARFSAPWFFDQTGSVAPDQPAGGGCTMSAVLQLVPNCAFRQWLSEQLDEQTGDLGLWLSR